MNTCIIVCEFFLKIQALAREYRLLQSLSSITKRRSKGALKLTARRSEIVQCTAFSK